MRPARPGGADARAGGGEMRHIATISGKDSLTMALLLKEREPQLPMEYVFADTGVEHPSTYAFLEEAREFLPELVVLRPIRSFADRMDAWGGFLPSKRNRWCTKELKIWSVQRYIGRDEVVLYVGLRADEEGRLGALTRRNEQVRYPLREHGIGLREVRTLIQRLGVSLPSRRGCFLCWGQKRWEWVKLGQEYPELFARAIEYEQMSPCSDFTFIRGLSLPELWEWREKIIERAERLDSSYWSGEDDDGNSVCRIWCR